MERVKIAERSVELQDEPGRFYVLVGPPLPSAAWRAAFLQLANRDKEGRHLALEVDGSKVIFSPSKGPASLTRCEEIIQGLMDQV